MEDRYLFKAKRLDNGEWIIGYLYRLSENHHPFIMLGNRYGESYEVDEHTICQCTGLKDKTGKLIFENDIVKYRIYQRTEHLYEIIYDCEEGSWTFGLRDVPLYSIGGANSEKCKVVGNKFDNPELLEV